MDKVAGPGSPRRWAPRGGAKAGRELASAVGSRSGETSDPGPKVGHSQGLLYVTQKRERGEVLEQGERSRDPRKSLHLSHLPIESLSCNSPHPWAH